MWQNIFLTRRESEAGLAGRWDEAIQEGDDGNCERQHVGARWSLERLGEPSSSVASAV